MKFVRNKFGIPGVIAVCALVFAMLGGAYAASNGDGGDASASAKKKKASKKGPRGPRGKRGKPGKNGAPGAPGAPGPAGPQGAQGGPGAKGDTGDKGATGEKGATGTDGNSVTVTDANEVDECVDVGGIVVNKEGEPPASAKEVCNGAQGEDGKEGSPWTMGGTLPPGATLTGSWAFNGIGSYEEQNLPISFPVPLSQEIAGPNVHYGAPTAITAVCPGGGSNLINPTAPPGKLCVYEGFLEGGTNAGGIWTISQGSTGANTAGAILKFTSTDSFSNGYGSWAVTGCDPTPGEPFECP